MKKAIVSLDGFAIHVQDVERSLAYYLRIPGASVELHRPGHIAVLRFGNNRLNLVRLDLQPPFHLEFEVEEVDQLYADFRGEAFPTEGAPEDKPWGERTFYSHDPDGSLVEFSKTLA